MGLNSSSTISNYAILGKSIKWEGRMAVLRIKSPSLADLNTKARGPIIQISFLDPVGALDQGMNIS